MSYYGDIEIVRREPGAHRVEMFIDAWQFDGEFLDLGYVCRRLSRHRLDALAEIEHLRWRVYAYARGRVNYKYMEAVKWLHRLRTAYRRDDDDYVCRYVPYGDDSYSVEGVYTNKKLSPLEQLAEIPEISEEQFACGAHLHHMTLWVRASQRRRQCVDAALMCAMYADPWIRDGIDDAGRGVVTINGRGYFVRSDWLAEPSLVDLWPQPGDATFKIGA